MRQTPGMKNHYDRALESAQMKVFVGLRERELQEGARFVDVVNLIQEAMKDEPMIRTIREKTGKANLILFTLNGRVVQLREYESLELKEGDDIRWFHPYAGG